MARSPPFRIVNGYGLFRVMTKERPEIILEGSDDAIEWKAYEFKWKPGALDRMPGFVEPHQPRLDWQMWFAALSDVRQNPWFFALAFRLLENSPEVVHLLGKNPFPDKAAALSPGRDLSLPFHHDGRTSANRCMVAARRRTDLFTHGLVAR